MVLPPFESRSDAAQALALQYPHHGDQIRVAGPQLDALCEELLTKKRAYRALSLEIAGLECHIKSKIGLFKGLRTKRGTWFWESTTERPRTAWKSLCKALGITKKLQAQFQFPAPPTRLLRFQPSPKSPPPLSSPPS